MNLSAVLASLLSATSINLSGAPVDVQAGHRFADTYVLSVAASAGSPESLRRILLQTAAHRTLADGRHAFTVGTRIVGTGVQAKLSEAYAHIFTTPDGSRMVLRIQELVETGTPRDESIDAQEALQILR